MLIYLDTMVWNKLHDEQANPADLVARLSTHGARIVLSTQAIYELAKTFWAQRDEARDRGTSLFSFVKNFVQLRVPCTKQNKTLLVEEARAAILGSQPVEIFLGANDYKRMEGEVFKLSQGIFNREVDQFISDREREAAQERHSTLSRIGTLRPRQKAVLESSDSSVQRWLLKMYRWHGRRLIRDHLKLQFPEHPESQLTKVAKKLMASNRFRLSHAIVKADLYIHWRAVRNEALPRDLLPDLDHMVNASYCDLYATLESGQGKYGSLVLPKSAVAIHNGQSSVAEWLISLANTKTQHS